MSTTQSGIGKLLLIVIILLLVIGLAGGGFVAWKVLYAKPATAAAGAESKPTPPPPPEKPVFFTLDPFTVNLQGGQFGDQLLYVGITLELGDAPTQAFLQEHLPQVRNRLLMVLSGQHADQIIASEGKQKLAAQIRDELSKPFAEGQPKLLVNHVLFTQFIVQ